MSEKAGNIEDRIKQLLIELLFLEDISPEDIAVDAPLAETIGLDSVAVFQVAAGVEEEYDFTFEDEEIDVERFGTVAGIVGVVREKLAADKESQGETG